MELGPDANDDEPIAQINVIPFVDIALTLLVVFMLTSSIIAKAAIPVDLPRAAKGGETLDPTVNVVLTADGTLFLDGVRVTREELRTQVEARVQADAKTRAAIAADKSVRYEKVVEVIDAVKRAGVTSFALDIEIKGS